MWLGFLDKEKKIIKIVGSVLRGTTNFTFAGEKDEILKAIYNYFVYNLYGRAP